MKKWYESKTVWLNIISTVTAIVGMGVLPIEVVKWFELAVGLANVVLRIWFSDTTIQKTIL